MVVKNYNIMGVAKAALESAVRYLAAELSPKGIRVRADPEEKRGPCEWHRNQHRRSSLKALDTNPPR